MNQENEIRAVLAAQPWCKGLVTQQIERLVRCARLETLDKGTHLARQNQPAETFYIILTGRVEVKLVAPGREQMVFETLAAGEVVGWSWLLPPHRWHFDARVLAETRVLAFAADCLRELLEADHEIGYRLLKWLLGAFSTRLQGMRLQFADAYGPPAV